MTQIQRVSVTNRTMHVCNQRQLCVVHHVIDTEYFTSPTLHVCNQCQLCVVNQMIATEYYQSNVAGMQSNLLHNDLVPSQHCVCIIKLFFTRVFLSNMIF